MAETKGSEKKRKSLSSTKAPAMESKKKARKFERKAKREEKKQRRVHRPGPRLSSSFRKEIGIQSPRDDAESDDGYDDEEERVRGDVFEYEEQVAEEETKKNRRFDPVDNYEYELPADFEDEDVPSDDEERHLNMLHGITGMPPQAFEGGEKKKQVVFLSVQGDASDGKISIQDLLDPLHGKPGYSNLRKRIDQLEKKPMAVQPPLPKVEREKLERKVAYKHSSKDITKWEPLVKRNREAPTLYFDKDVNLGFSTVGAIASGFEPRTEFEKKMASLTHDPEVTEAHWKDGAKLLELNKLTVEDVKDRQGRLAKMRSLLFRHEMKSKHIKKIKSKTYHRILKKERSKAAASNVEMDPEAAKEEARKQEYKRAEERMTLKHKNSSKWAKRILKRGLDVQDEGTRAAISEQLNQHALLTRKMNSMKDSSSSDVDSDDDNEETDSEDVSKLLNKAKEKTVKVLEEKDEITETGVMALPFMQRGLKKKKEAADEEAQRALEEYDLSLRQLDDDEEGDVRSKKTSGRKVFGTPGKQAQETNNQNKSDYRGNSDSEDDFDNAEHVQSGLEADNVSPEVQTQPDSLHDDPRQKSVFKTFDDIVKDPGPKTTFEVAIFASDSWRKMKPEDAVNVNKKKQATAKQALLPDPTPKEEAMYLNSNSDTDEEIVEGDFSFNAVPEYELPSQADLVHHAFATDDVEAQFEKDKLDVLNEENPEPEKPVLLPGWGQWTNVQKKKGVPSWMLEEHEMAKKKREEALKKRKDAHLRHVIISETTNKKAEKLLAKSLPFPFTSKEVYEQSIRMPIGPEFNPARSVRALNRPEVIKKAGVIIEPIKFEEMDPHENPDEPKQIIQNKSANNKRKSSKSKKSSGSKVSRK
ncbi:putative small-subunit processome, Utp14 protein [Dioscorea sansibarensis]